MSRHDPASPRPRVLQTLLATFAILALGGAIDSAVIDAAGSQAWRAAAVAAAVGLATATLAWWSVRAASRDQIAMESQERHDLLAHVLRLGPVHRTHSQTGALVSTATDGVERHAQYRATFLGSMIGSMIAPLAVVAMIAVAIDWRSALWLLAALPLVPLLIGGFRKAFASVSSRYRASAKRFSAAFLDSLQGLPTLRALGAGRRRADELEVQAEDVRRNVMKMLLGNQLVLLVADAVFSLAMIVLATSLAAAGLRDGLLSPGDAIALVLLSTLMTEPLDRIGQFFYIGMGGMAAQREIRALLAQELPPAADGPEPATSDASIRLRAVGFSYVDGAPVLTDFDVEVAPGERVVLAGPSGAGKTTVLSLVQGYRTPSAGSVSVGGHSVATVPPAWLHRQIGVVSQGTYLFTGTLRDNLLLARPDADDAQLLAALERARLGDEVRSWPLGLDTPVGERGLSLSGGQAQRVSIARALLADSPILLLDEPTSQTDLASEALILEAITDLCAHRTVLAVGHREAMLAQATRVVTVGGAA